MFFHDELCSLFYALRCSGERGAFNRNSVLQEFPKMAKRSQVEIQANISMVQSNLNEAKQNVMRLEDQMLPVGIPRDNPAFLSLDRRVGNLQNRLYELYTELREASQ